MAKAVRIIIYEGSEEVLKKQLERSLSPGTHHLMTMITIQEVRFVDPPAEKPADIWKAVKEFCRG